jgi:hypothetical protein
MAWYIILAVGFFGTAPVFLSKVGRNVKISFSIIWTIIFSFVAWVWFSSPLIHDWPALASVGVILCFYWAISAFMWQRYFS